MIGPPSRQWPPGTVAWCQWCDRPIRLFSPYMPTIPFVGSFGGFTHQDCRRPKRRRRWGHLRVVQ